MGTTNRHFISRTANALLRDRTLSELSRDEFVLLLKSYNAVGATKESFATTLAASAKFPDDVALLQRHHDIACVWLSTPELLAELRRCLIESRGTKPFWHLALAHFYIGQAWNGNEHLIGLPEHHGYLEFAARELEADGVWEFHTQAVKGGTATHQQLTFNEEFDGLLRFEQYAHLRRGA